MSDNHPEFNSTRIFLTLFVLTAVEVGWSFIPFARWAIWAGLMVFATWKGLLIFTYFMHMKYEGWVVKALIAPTPILILIIVFALMPDIAKNDHLLYPVAAQHDPATGQVVNMGDAAGEPGEHDHGPDADHTHDDGASGH
jgi:caa(3)-type oxidase subunit IV